MGAGAAAFITFLGSLVTASVSWMGDVLGFMVENPVILIPTLVFFIGGGVIGLVSRILRG